jgi:hypothetical protein
MQHYPGIALIQPRHVQTCKLGMVGCRTFCKQPVGRAAVSDAGRELWCINSCYQVLAGTLAGCYLQLSRH